MLRWLILAVVTLGPLALAVWGFALRRRRQRYQRLAIAASAYKGELRQPVIAKGHTPSTHLTRAERRRCFLCSPDLSKDLFSQRLARGTERLPTNPDGHVSFRVTRAS